MHIHIYIYIYIYIYTCTCRPPKPGSPDHGSSRPPRAHERAFVDPHMYVYIYIYDIYTLYNIIVVYIVVDYTMSIVDFADPHERTRATRMCTCGRTIVSSNSNSNSPSKIIV